MAWEERTVKLSLSKLTGGAPDSRLLNDVLNEFVHYTGRIRVMGHIILNLTLHRYVNQQEQLIAANANHVFNYTPANLRFDDQAFVYQAFNRAFHANPARITSSPHLRQTVVALNANNAAFPNYRPFPNYDGEFDFGGKSQIIGYLRLMYIANFRSSTPAKSMAVVNDGIKALKQTHLSGLSRNARNVQLTEIKRQLFYPFRQAPAGVQLSQVCQDFVNFHRNGFNLPPGQAMRREYFQGQVARFNRYAIHIARSVKRLEELQAAFPDAKIKRRLALPMSNLASRCSMYLDKQLLYYVMKGYVLFGGVIPNNLPGLPNRFNDFNANMYYQYMITMFKISNVIRGPDRVFCIVLLDNV